jgi:hypothetical protein
LLEKHGLYERVTKGYGKSTVTPQEKEKEKEKDKEKDWNRTRQEREELRRFISRENKGREYKR